MGPMRARGMNGEVGGAAAAAAADTADVDAIDDPGADGRRAHRRSMSTSEISGCWLTSAIHSSRMGEFLTCLYKTKHAHSRSRVDKISTDFRCENNICFCSTYGQRLDEALEAAVAQRLEAKLVGQLQQGDAIVLAQVPIQVGGALVAQVKEQQQVGDAQQVGLQSVWGKCSIRFPRRG